MPSKFSYGIGPTNDAGSSLSSNPLVATPPSVYKINCNGATFQDSTSAGLGVVVLDSNGQVIAALSERFSLPPTVEVLEALACRKAVSFAIDLLIQDIVFKGDSEIIFKHLSSDQPSLVAFGHIVDDAHSLVATLRISIFHIPNARVIWWQINSLS